jgi:hypothetical protein
MVSLFQISNSCENKGIVIAEGVSTWLSALPSKTLVSLYMLVIPCVEIRYIKDRMTRCRHRVMVYWNGLELVRLQKIKIL